MNEDYIYTDEILTAISYVDKNKVLVKEKAEYLLDKKIIKARWVFDKNGMELEKRLYDPNGAPYKKIVNDNGKKLTAVYSFLNNVSHQLVICGFKVYKSGNLIQEYGYNAYQPVLTGKNLEPVAIVGSGFDITHFMHKLWANPLELVDGIDNDCNGWIDDMHGWHYDSAKKIDSGNIGELPIYDKGLPFSHETHVASLVLQDISKFGMVGFAGDYTNPEYIRQIGNFLQKHKIKYCNLSFNWGSIKSMIMPGSESDSAWDHVIGDNQQCLFFSTASNDYHRNLDTDPNLFSRLSRKYNNIIIVGSIESFEKPTLTDFTNIGWKSVTLYAPGRNLEGALIGGGTVRESGTSMSSPLALNIALRIDEMYDSPPIDKIKNMLISNAIKPVGEVLPSISGGYINPNIRSYKSFF